MLKPAKIFMNFLLWNQYFQTNQNHFDHLDWTNNGLLTGKAKNLTPDFVLTMAVTVLFVGAVGSIGLVLNAGRKTPVLLLVLFVGWVLSPFKALLVANRVSKRWSVPTRATIYCLILVVTLGSLVGYNGAFNSPDTKPAFMFLAVPLISWLLMVTAMPITRRLSRKSNNINKT